MVKALNSADFGSASIINLQVRILLLELININYALINISISPIISFLLFVSSFVRVFIPPLTLPFDRDIRKECIIQA